MQNNSSSQKAKTAWMLAFGDVITLLITFFILVLALESGNITKSQKWGREQLDTSGNTLLDLMNGTKIWDIKRTTVGIELSIKNAQAFKNGGYEPTEQLLAELKKLAKKMKKLPIIQLKKESFPPYVQKMMREKHLRWHVDINIAGYTDNGFVNPYSRLKNNWLLSTMRAQSVMQALIKYSNLPRSLFSVAGYGQYRPIASNKTKEGRAKNRRVEILITAVLEHKD